MTSSPIPRIAAIVARLPGEADGPVNDFASKLRAQGWRIRGLLQDYRPDCENCQILLADLDDGTLYPISQDLGPGSVSCGLDPTLIAEAGVVMRRIAHEGADLAIFNRFGGLEAEGGGFADEMLQLMSGEIPVLTIVPDRHLTRWREFTGGLALELPPTQSAMLGWFSALRSTPQNS